MSGRGEAIVIRDLPLISRETPISSENPLTLCRTKLKEDLMAKGNNARKKETKKPKKDKK